MGFVFNNFYLREGILIGAMIMVMVFHMVIIGVTQTALQNQVNVVLE